MTVDTARLVNNLTYWLLKSGGDADKVIAKVSVPTDPAGRQALENLRGNLSDAWEAFLEQIRTKGEPLDAYSNSDLEELLKEAVAGAVLGDLESLANNVLFELVRTGGWETYTNEQGERDIRPKA